MILSKTLEPKECRNRPNINDLLFYMENHETA